MEPAGCDQQKIWDFFQTEGVDAFDRSRGRLEFLVRRLRPGMRALNVGVGNGALERMAAGKGVDIWSLDPSDGAIAHLRQTLDLGAKAQTGLCQSMPFPDAHFDAVIMSEVLEHLEPDTFEQALAEARRVLRPGGMFIGTVPAREKLEESLVVCPQCGVKFHRWGHKRSFDSASLSRALERLFTPVAVSERFFIEWESAGWWKKFQGLIKKLLSWRGIGPYGASRNIYFCFRKPTH